MRKRDITQKLVVNRWHGHPKWEGMYAYIATIVPTPEYHAGHRHNVGREFRYAGAKGNFSGFVVYRSLDGILVAIDNYREGQLTRHDYFSQITEHNADSVQRIALLTLRDVTLQAGTPQMYAIGGELDEPFDWNLSSDPITVTAHQNKPWLITITVRPNSLPDPIDIPIYNSPSFPTGGGGGGGSGGGGSIASTGRPTILSPVNCNNNESSAKTATAEMYAIMQKCITGDYNSPAFSAFMNAVSSQPGVEHFTSMRGYDNNIMLTPIQHGAADGSTVSTTDITPSTLTMIHSHPSGHLTPPSARDVIETAGVLADGANSFQGSYIYVGGEVYSLQITNPDQARAFYQANGNGLDGNDFNTTSAAGKLWTAAKDRMRSLPNENDRYVASMAYVLAMSNSGIVMSKMGVGEKSFSAYGIRNNSKGEVYPSKCK